jgi:hypothetical protein
MAHDPQMTGASRSPAAQGRFAVAGDPGTRMVLAAFLLGRLAVVAAAVLAEAQRGITAAAAVSPTGAKMLWTDVPILSSLTSWDGVNYLLLAASGYAVNPTNGPFPLTVFFPGYPASIAVARLAGEDGSVLAVLLSNVAFAAALLVVLRLGRVVVSEQQAVLGAVFLALAGGGTAFSMAYSDSLFLLLSAASLLAAERGRAAWMGVLFAMAAVTRLPGIALGVPLLMILWSRPDRRWTTPWLALGPLAVGAFFGYLGVVNGDPLAALHGQAVWDAAYAGGLPQIVEPSGAWSPVPILGNPLLVGGAFIVLLTVTAVAGILAPRAGVPAPYVVLILIAVLSVLASGRLVSADRYLAVAFPVGWVIAAAGRPVRIAWAVFSLVVLVTTSYLSFRLVLPP